MRWRELNLHSDLQDTDCDAWMRLLELVDRAASNRDEVFEPGAHFEWDDWVQIVTLPASVSQLKCVRELRLYGSNFVRIPPEIGEMTALEELDVYTSYRLHWLPYEVTRCKNLRESRISTRALYGNYKYRPPFPRLPSGLELLSPNECSVCRGPFGQWGPRQVWISLRIATDVVPLLVHACSRECIDKLPAPARGYINKAHRGSLGVAQPPTGIDSLRS